MSAQILPPPTERYSLLGWLHKNLFSSGLNAALTVITALGLAAALPPVFDWGLNHADWAVINANLQILMVGRYPAAELWRVWVGVLLGAALFGMTWGVWVHGLRVAGGLAGALPFLILFLPLEPAHRLLWALTGGLGWAGWALARWRPDRARPFVTWGWVAYLPLLLLIVHGWGPEGAFFGTVPSTLWGGLLLTALLTIVGVVFSFPLGIALALGRQSALPIIRNVCVVIIEVVRGVPFVSVIFMVQFMLPLFLPAGVTIDSVARAMAAIVIFSAAYLAENVRGGLQAVPRGQTEAARALGLNPAQTMGLVVLPQALRLVIPILVGQFIALFKDTSLVVIVGLLDLMGMAKSVLAQPDFLGRQAEVYLFLALVYGVFCYFMSALSQQLEKSLGVGQR